MFNTENVITSQEVEQVLSGIVNLLDSYKNKTERLTDSKVEEMHKIISQLVSYVEESSQEVEATKKEAVLSIKNQISSGLLKIKKAYSDLDSKYSEMVLKSGVDGIDGKDGKDADEERIIQEVLSKIPKLEKDSGEEIVKSINELNTDDDGLKIDAKHIKNLPSTVTNTHRVFGIKGIVAGPGISVDNSNMEYPKIINTGVAGGGTSDHSLLTNLTNDDHPQYHNNTRGDARYYQKSEVFTKAETQAEISAIVDAAPTTLNTLNELAAALGDDPNFATTISTQIGQKENSENKVTTFTGNTASNTLFPTIKAVYDWATATFAALSHSHTAAQVTDFSTAVSANTDVTANTAARHTHSNQTVLNATTASYTTAEQTKLSGIQTGAEVNVNADWNATSGDAQILNKPTTMTPSAHTHAISDVTGLQTALDGKSSTSHTHTLDNLSDVVITSPTTGQVIKYDGTNWINDTDATASGGSGVTDHGALTGLGDDDHTQYHNDTRGDARYYTKSQVDTSLSSKVDSNTAITGATKTKVTYDAKGLVTNGADATTADIADSTNKRYVTDAQLTVIGNTSGTNTGDETTATIKSKLSITTLSGSNTGDQTSIAGITGTTAQFNTALTDGDFATLAGTETLTNKEVARRMSSTTTAAALNPTYGLYDDYAATALASAITISNPTGTPKDGQQFIIRLKDNGTARGITFGTAYRAIGVTLPTTTVISKTVYIGCKYNSGDAKVDVIAIAQEA